MSGIADAETMSIEENIVTNNGRNIEVAGRHKEVEKNIAHEEVVNNIGIERSFTSSPGNTHGNITRGKLTINPVHDRKSGPDFTK